ncbi:SWI/SNF and RSC complexes subunit ssr3 [Echria macrotheca]|uniref:SWI/SNF and RSC complexes subunit ssr3 n=1 Tax=Echria macrotheca TaxID=438768 RepID=A0AAJ0BNH4_9PEZI|nr:SWI/SNF and RSC complexes subunit ssr3 [Echria macrotheca]
MMSAGPHHSVPMTQAQINQQQEQQKAALHNAKLRSTRPTDKSLPDGIEEACVDSGEVARAYKKLRDFERRLDATITRKRLDIMDTVNRNEKRYKTLRVWITNTVEDQFWQTNGLNVDTFDFTTTSEASYRVRIQARLLDDEDDADKDQDESKRGTDEGGDKMETDSPSKAKNPAASARPGQRSRFSHFFKALTVEFDRSALGRPPTDMVEWKKPQIQPNAATMPAAADFDELCFKRNGDENTNITINLYRHEDPERFELSDELAEVVDAREATRQEAVMGVFEYIKLFNLLEDEEKRNFRCDDLLKPIIRKDSGQIPMLGEYITPHLRPLPPYKLPYTIRVDEEFHKDPKPTIYDLRVTVDNPLRAKMMAFLYSPEHAQTMKRIAEIDKDLGVLIQAIYTHKAKHTFLRAMCDDPVGTVRSWLSSQKRDLEVIMGEATRGGGENATGDEWRRGGRESVWNTPNARESVNVLLSKPVIPR